MRLVHAALAVALFVLATATPSPAADDAVRCKAAILSRGTTLFDATTDVVARCVRRALRTANLDEGCPTERGNERITALDLVASEAIDSACTAPIQQTLTCVVSGIDEAFDLVSGVFRVGAGEAPHGPKLRCLDTIGRQAVRLAELTDGQLALCNEKLARGVAGYGPSGPTCDGPSGTQAAIAAADARLASKLTRACGGPDGIAGTNDDLDPQAALGFGATCPGLPYCAFAIDTLPDLITCASCIAQQEVDQASRGLATLPLDAPTACDVGKGRAVMTLLEDDLRDLAACEDRILEGHETGHCPNGETFDDLLVNAAQYAGRVLAACAAPGPSANILSQLAFDLIDALYPTHAEEPDNARQRCKLAIRNSVVSTARYARRKLRTLRSCHTQRLCGQTSVACPDSEASAAIARAATSTANDIHTRCDAYTPSTLGYGPTCPSAGACGALPATTIDELITCLQCIGDEVVDGGESIAF